MVQYYEIHTYTLISALRIFFWPIVLLLLTVGAWFLRLDLWGNLYLWVRADPLDRIILIISCYLLWKGIVLPGIRFVYAIGKARSIVTMKVMLPRSDSKIDQEKRTEKDWKEKIAVMEQLFRALSEVRSLTIWQYLHYLVFHYIVVSFELYIEKGELVFYVATTPDMTSIVEKQITSFYPDAEVSEHPIPTMWQKGRKTIAYNMLLEKKFMYPIRFYEQMQDDPLNELSNVLSKLNADDAAGIQVILRPSLSGRYSKAAKRYASTKFKGKEDHWTGRIPIISSVIRFLWGVQGAMGTNAPGATHGDSFVRMIQPEEELYKHMGEKAGSSWYHCSVRIMASSTTWKRALEITNNVQVGFNVFRNLFGNAFVNRRLFFEFFPHVLNAPIMRWLWMHRINGFVHRDSLLVDKELAGLYHFPDSRYNKIPTVQWISYRILPPPPDTPREGILLGHNRHQGRLTDIRILDEDRTRHQYVIGKSGTGKSVLLSFMARQDVARGKGVCLVDPHGDLIEDVLRYVPKERAKDIVIFDPSDTERPMGLNLLEAKTDEEKDRASLDAMEIFIKLFGNEIFGPRIQHYFRNGCLTLMDDEEEGATLIDVPRLFVDDEFQHYKVSKCKNPVVRSFWEHEIAKTGAREKEEMIPYFSAKFGPFITNTTIRNIIGQPKSAFDVRTLMDSEKVLLVNLSKGKIGDTNAQLLGLIFVNKVNMAALSRADMPEDQRKPFYLYVDEFQNFTTDAFATILSEARKYNLALIMAHQYIGQLVAKTSAYEQQNTKLRDAVFGNVGTMLSFKIGAEDAEYMAKEYAPVLSEQDVIGIANYKCYIKLNIHNTTSRPFSMETIW
ncbi:MAG: type IV secretion system DNA-binding domain-containing protein, partial [Patescibacteria group bacterium]